MSEVGQKVTNEVAPGAAISTRPIPGAPLKMSSLRDHCIGALLSDSRS